MFAKKHNKENLEAIHLDAIKTGPGDLTLKEWDQKMIEEKHELHGHKAFNAVYGLKDNNGTKNIWNSK